MKSLYWTASTVAREECIMPEEPRDVYTDRVTIGLGPYGLSLIFGLSDTVQGIPGQPQPATTQAVVRMSLEHAKVMVMILRKNLKQFELEHLGDPIRIPQRVLRESGLSEEDW